MDPPDTNMQLSLNELIYGDKDRNLGSCSLPPFEHVEIQNGYPTVNEEFIFMTESFYKFSGHLDVAQFLNTSTLSKRLRGVLGVSRTENIETVLSAEVGCPGIIDTGASKSVIGQRKVKKLIASLPASVQSRVQWGKSDTVFRFGNNATLSSVGALYIPFGGCWMRLEVVSGDTPFLLSNAFLKATSADVSSRNSELVFHQQGCKVPLQVNSKGLFTVELSEVLKAFAKSDGKRQVAGSCEVVTYVSK